MVLWKLSSGMDPTTTPMHLADFWLHIHKLTSSFFTEIVGRGLGNFVCTFVRYDDERNVYRSNSLYLQVRITLDITKPLPCGKKIVHPRQPSFMCEFRNHGHHGAITPQQLLPPNLQVFQHNYAAHVFSPAPNNDVVTRLDKLETETLALQEERKRPRMAHIRPGD
ncbi:hypothetical protein LINGRAHAP2_LOCUS30199 [Linum grandiflorum]